MKRLTAAEDVGRDGEQGETERRDVRRGAGGRRLYILQAVGAVGWLPDRVCLSLVTRTGGRAGRGQGVDWGGSG